MRIIIELDSGQPELQIIQKNQDQASSVTGVTSTGASSANDGGAAKFGTDTAASAIMSNPEAATTTGIAEGGSNTSAGAAPAFENT